MHKHLLYSITDSSEQKYTNSNGLAVATFNIIIIIKPMARYRLHAITKYRPIFPHTRLTGTLPLYEYIVAPLTHIVVQRAIKNAFMLDAILPCNGRPLCALSSSSGYLFIAGQFSKSRTATHLLCSPSDLSAK